MNYRSRPYWAIWLVPIIWTMGNHEALAQSGDAVHKRSFAELLARKAKVSAERSERAILAEKRTVRPAPEPNHLARSTDAHRHSIISMAATSAIVRPLASGSAFGIAAATPVTPSGYGTGRDTFVETLYQEILGRDLVQSEEDYWSRALARGGPTEAIAKLIWNSREHRTLLRNHEAPNIPLGTAYRDALAAGQKNKQE